MITKTKLLKTAMINNEWKQAISIASKFKNLQGYDKIIQQAHQAYTNPRFTTQIGLNVDDTIEKGILTLKVLYNT